MESAITSISDIITPTLTGFDLQGPQNRVVVSRSNHFQWFISPPPFQSSKSKDKNNTPAAADDAAKRDNNTPTMEAAK